MKQYDVYEYRGGYRVALDVVAGAPVTCSLWYPTRRGAQCAANNARRNAARRGAK